MIKEENKKSILFLISAVILWTIILSAGFIKLYHYEFKAGSTDYTAEVWPQGTTIPRSIGNHQLIMFAHPQCPCSNASLTELELIMAHGMGKVNAYVVFIKPKQFNEMWVKSNLFKNAEKVPGVQVVIDEEGKEAKLFGGTTSGQTFLYNQEGQLVFSGGITGSRGHVGDNAGQNAIIDLINNKSVAVERTPFFGCLLHDQEKDKDLFEEK